MKFENTLTLFSAVQVHCDCPPHALPRPLHPHQLQAREHILIYSESKISKTLLQWVDSDPGLEIKNLFSSLFKFEEYLPVTVGRLCSWSGSSLLFSPSPWSIQMLEIYFMRDFICMFCSIIRYFPIIQENWSVKYIENLTEADGTMSTMKPREMVIFECTEDS